MTVVRRADAEGDWAYSFRAASSAANTTTIVLPPATLEEALDGVGETEDREVDCTKPCWRHVDGGGQCECEEGDSGTWQPGC